MAIPNQIPPPANALNNDPNGPPGRTNGNVDNTPHPPLTLEPTAGTVAALPYGQSPKLDPLAGMFASSVPTTTPTNT